MKHEMVANHPPKSTTTTAKDPPEYWSGGKASAKLEVHTVAKHPPNSTTMYGGKACAREVARQQCIR